MISLRLNLVGLFFGAMFGGILAAGALHEYGNRWACDIRNA